MSTLVSAVVLVWVMATAIVSAMVSASVKVTYFSKSLPPFFVSGGDSARNGSGVGESNLFLEILFSFRVATTHRKYFSSNSNSNITD